MNFFRENFENVDENFENFIDLFSIITIYFRNWRLNWIHVPNIIKWDVERLIYDTRRVSFHISSLAPSAFISVAQLVARGAPRFRNPWKPTEEDITFEINKVGLFPIVQPIRFILVFGKSLEASWIIRSVILWMDGFNSTPIIIFWGVT